MKAKLAALVLATMLGASPAMANGIGEGCDTVDGRDGGMQFCDSGLICVGPYEGMYGHGNCQASGGGCDTIAGREGGQQMCPSGMTCTGPFEGMYGHGNCQ
jgi:hypothetical protein